MLTTAWSHRRARVSCHDFCTTLAPPFSRSLALAQIKDKVSKGPYQTLLGLAVEDRTVLDAELLHKAMKGLGTNESVLTEIICMRSNAELTKINEFFAVRYQKEVMEMVRDEVSGNYLKLLEMKMRCKRPEGEDAIEGEEVASDQAAQLYKAGQGKVGTDEKVFVKIFAGECSREQIQLVKVAYEEEFGSTLEEAVKKETSGDFRDALQALMAVPAVFFAGRIQQAMKGMGADKTMVARALGGNDKADMPDIIAAFQELAGGSLDASLKSELSGSFLSACQQWVLAPTPSVLHEADQIVEKEEGLVDLGGGKGDDAPPEEAEGEPGEEPGPEKLRWIRNGLLDCIARRDAQSIYKACKGLGCDEGALIKILCCRTRAQVLWRAMPSAQEAARSVVDWILIVCCRC